MELFNEDRIAHPQNPHVFVVPRLMTHLWRKNLGKDADVMFTVAPAGHFWERTQHEPLIVAVVLPLSYVRDYRGPWLARGSDEAQSLSRELSAGFKYFRDRRRQGLFDVAGPLCSLWHDAEGRSRTLLREFLRWARKFPPVQECLVRGLLQRESRRSVPQAIRSSGRKRRRRARDGRGGPPKVSKRV